LEAFRLDGQTAIVTGAARGLGQALALGLAEGGANVAAVDIAPTEETAGLVRNLGRRCHAVRADLAAIDPARAAALVDDVTAALARPTILVNNAGVIHRAPAVDHSQEAWNATLAVDLSAPFVLAQAFARPLLADGTPGKVVNVVSMLSFQGGLNVPAYAAAKSGLAGLTRALGQRVGGARHQRQRDRPRLHGDRADVGAAGGPGAGRGDAGADPRRPMGHPRRP
jgi:2-deoxy-D-gluconate 3-dehydrogenase